VGFVDEYERLLLGDWNDGNGSIAPIRLRYLRTLDQLFMLVGVPNLWRSALKIARHACDIELRLLRLETGHSQRELCRA
jgi:hypothetical protein